MIPGFNSSEKRAVFALAGVYFMRMFGLFVILPVFVLYAEHLDGASLSLAGIAIGIYGLTQALLQLPFGLASDRWGRKPVILFGLLLFVVGSVVAATADHILGVIVGRALQGSGAIAAALMALNADLTREENRTKAMATIGMSIGMAFFLALIAAPVLTNWIGVQGLFWMTGGLALLGMGLIQFVVPNPVRSGPHSDAMPVPAQLGSVLKDGQLLRLDLGIFSLHAILTALFIAVPFMLRDQLGLAVDSHWRIYLAVLVLSVAAMVPFVIIAERAQKMKPVFVGSVMSIALALAGLWFAHDALLTVGAWMVVFFTAFNILEASLPSLVSKIAPPDRKGSAMGIYSSSQFFGAFVGGTVGGSLMQQFGTSGVLAFGIALAAVWLLAASSMRAPKSLTSRLLKVGAVEADQAALLAKQLTTIPGVAEAVVLVDEGVAYLKIDKRQAEESLDDDLQKMAASGLA